MQYDATIQVGNTVCLIQQSLGEIMVDLHVATFEAKLIIKLAAYL